MTVNEHEEISSVLLLVVLNCLKAMATDNAVLPIFVFPYFEAKMMELNRQYK